MPQGSWPSSTCRRSDRNRTSRRGPPRRRSVLVSSRNHRCSPASLASISCSGAADADTAAADADAVAAAAAAGDAADAAAAAAVVAVYRSILNY